MKIQAGAFFFLAITLLATQAFTASPESCLSAAEANWNTASAETKDELVQQTLVCLTQADRLTSLGALSLMAIKMDMRVGHTANVENVAWQIRDNPYDSNGDANVLWVNFNHDENRSLKDFLQRLEKEILPEALQPRDAGADDALSRFQKTFTASMRQHMAAVDTPPRGYNEVPADTNGVGGLFRGSLDYTFQHLSGLSAIFTFTARLLLGWDRYTELNRLYKSLTHCDETICLAAFEKRVAQGLLWFLGRADLAQELFRHRDDNFTPKTFNSNVGCTDRAFGATGARLTRLNHDHQFGWKSYLGEAIYLQALDHRDVTHPVYIGQNGLIRRFSSAAYESLTADEGVGANPQYVMAATPHARDLNLSMSEFNQKFEVGVSKRMVRYWIKRQQSELYGRTHRGREARAMRKEADDLIATPFFKDTIYSEGKSLTWWVEYLYQTNPNTPYQIWFQDYQFRPSTSGRSTVYDRLVAVSLNLPALFP